MGGVEGKGKEKGGRGRRRREEEEKCWDEMVAARLRNCSQEVEVDEDVVERQGTLSSGRLGVESISESRRNPGACRKNHGHTCG